jgi:hypothetical protein
VTVWLWGTSPVIGVTLPEPAIVDVAVPRLAVIAVEWPPVRVTRPRMPARPSAVIGLPARQQRPVRGPVPLPAFRAIELMHLHPRLSAP